MRHDHVSLGVYGSEFPTLARLISTILLLAALLGAAQPPLANFTGVVHGISTKQITIENPDGNLVDFEINRKTKVMRGKKEIQIDDIMSGDEVTIEARQEMLQFLVAVVITVQEPLGFVRFKLQLVSRRGIGSRRCAAWQFQY